MRWRTRGLDSVTISLDTLDASVYRQLTRRDELEAVRRGLRTAIQKGRMQIKINCVPVLGIEEQNAFRGGGTGEKAITCTCVSSK